MGEEREDEGSGGEKGEGGDIMGEWKEGQGCQNLFLNCCFCSLLHEIRFVSVAERGTSSGDINM